MTFVVTYSMEPDKIEAASRRFLAGGAPAREGVEIIGRWHRAGGHSGWVVVETSDAGALGMFLGEWIDLMKFEVTPVVDDATLGKNLSQLFK